MNFTQQYGKNRQRYQQNTYYYVVWQLLLYFYREFPSKILSVCFLERLEKFTQISNDLHPFTLPTKCSNRCIPSVSQLSLTCDIHNSVTFTEDREPKYTHSYYIYIYTHKSRVGICPVSKLVGWYVQP